MWLDGAGWGLPSSPCGWELAVPHLFEGVWEELKAWDQNKLHELGVYSQVILPGSLWLS